MINLYFILFFQILHTNHSTFYSAKHIITCFNFNFLCGSTAFTIWLVDRQFFGPLFRCRKCRGFRAATSWAPHEHLAMAKDSRVQVKAGIFVSLSLGLIPGETKCRIDGKLHLLEFHKAVWWDQAYSRYQNLLSCGHPRQDPCNNDVLHEAFNNQARSIHEPGSVKVAQQDNGTSLL